MRNAFERGEPLQKVGQSFINAGYRPEEVNLALQMVGAIPSQPLPPQLRPIPAPVPQASVVPKPSTEPPKQLPAPIPAPQSLKQPLPQPKPIQAPVSSPVKPISQMPAPTQNSLPVQNPSSKRSRSNKVLIIILLIIFSLLVVGGALIGLFWEQLFAS